MRSHRQEEETHGTWWRLSSPIKIHTQNTRSVGSNDLFQQQKMARFCPTKSSKKKLFHAAPKIWNFSLKSEAKSFGEVQLRAERGAHAIASISGLRRRPAVSSETTLLSACHMGRWRHTVTGPAPSTGVLTEGRSLTWWIRALIGHGPYTGGAWADPTSNPLVRGI